MKNKRKKNRINKSDDKKKRGYFSKILILSFIFLCLTTYHATAVGNVVFTMLEYSDIPENVRNIANLEIKKRMLEGLRSNHTYEGFGFNSNYVERFDATKDAHTTQSKIYADEHHPNVWNIAYFGMGTREFLGTVLMDLDGNILLSYAGWDAEFRSVLEDMTGRSFYDWTFEEQHAYDELFVHNTFVDEPHWHYSIPKPDDLPLEALVDLGKKYLLGYYAVPNEEVNGYDVQKIYFTNLGYPGDLGPEEGKMILRFVDPNSPRAYEYQVTMSAVNGTIYFSTPFPTNP